MGKVWWWRRRGGLDAAQRRVLRSRLGEIDYDLKQIIWDVGRVAGTSAAAAPRNQEPDK